MVLHEWMPQQNNRKRPRGWGLWRKWERGFPGMQWPLKAGGHHFPCSDMSWAQHASCLPAPIHTDPCNHTPARRSCQSEPWRKALGTLTDEDVELASQPLYRVRWTSTDSLIARRVITVSQREGIPHTLALTPAFLYLGFKHFLPMVLCTRGWGSQK